MKLLLWILVSLLLILNQDFWQWGRADIVFGFVPYAMAYQIVVSIATAIVWVIVVQNCWPDDVDDIQPLIRPHPKRPAARGGNSS